MTTIKDILNSIQSLVETQNKGHKEVNQKLKEVVEVQKRNEEAQRKNVEIQRKNEEARKKSLAEIDQKFKESEESRKELQKTLNKFIGESGHQWGKFIETLTNTGAVNLLKKRGIQVEMTSTHVKDKNYRYEIDVLAVNGKEIVAIEAKKYLRKKDVDDAIERFKRFKKYNKEAHRKILYGAVAYLECEKGINLYAERKGLFVFQVTGNSAKMNNSDDFKPEPLSA